MARSHARLFLAAEAYPELLLQVGASTQTGHEDAVDVTMELPGGNLRLPAQYGLHQGVMDEDILLLQGEREWGDPGLRQHTDYT